MSFKPAGGVAGAADDRGRLQSSPETLEARLSRLHTARFVVAIFPRATDPHQIDST
ncbi:unnamed protein product, partial [Nesidiocoris tenuis]